MTIETMDALQTALSVSHFKIEKKAWIPMDDKVYTVYEEKGSLVQGIRLCAAINAKLTPPHPKFTSLLKKVKERVPQMEIPNMTFWLGVYYNDGLDTLMSLFDNNIYPSSFDDVRLNKDIVIPEGATSQSCFSVTVGPDFPAENTPYKVAIAECNEEHFYFCGETIQLGAREFTAKKTRFMADLSKIKEKLMSLPFPMTRTTNEEASCTGNVRTTSFEALTYPTTILKTLLAETPVDTWQVMTLLDRKSTRLNSSHSSVSRMPSSA